MTYTLRYANLDSIQRKLNNRLNIDSSEFYPVEEVDSDLILDVAEEKEDELDKYLGEVYELPLRNNHVMVKNISENLIMAELIDYEYINTSGNDLSDYSFKCKKKAYNAIAKLTAGVGIPIPEADALGYYAQQINNTPITLPGEVFTSDLPKTNTSNNFTYIGTITSDDNTVGNWLIDDRQINNPFSMDYR